ncbi:MAG: hypothetical protein ABIX28_22345 [Vicinamibacterales bacterium]
MRPTNRPVTGLWWVLVEALALLLAVVSIRAQSAPPSNRPAVTTAHAAAGLFTHSDNCLACHNTLTSASGEDVSIGTAWRSTIMANAARDPYFHASVRRETLDHPSRSREIQDECAACHVPIATRAAHTLGRLASVLVDPAMPVPDAHDPLARDGVSCTVCHQIAPDGPGSPVRFNGVFQLGPSRPDGVREVFGPLAVDTGRRTIMRSVTGFEQVESPHVRQSELCATCHTLITQALDSAGRVVGSLPEQMNYQEWRHSAFYVEQRSCQSCHMPRAEGPVRVSSVVGDVRDGLSRHAFVGGNAFMLRLLNRFRDVLGVTAPSGELEATARLTEQQLRHDTAAVEVSAPLLGDGQVGFTVQVRNLTGHKFPTGYPARRAWLRVRVLDADLRPLFESGAVTATGSIAGADNDADPRTFEPHYEVIERPEQVQIYESILGDLSSQPTTGLLAATQYLKDNRLLPRGFDKPTADAQIGVFGAAAADGNFVGGGDVVTYRVTLPAGQSWRRIEVALLYQPIGYRWAHNLDDYRASETAAFASYYRAMEASTSTVVATATVDRDPTPR